MNIQVPWNTRLRSGLQSSPYDSDFWLRRKYCEDLDVAKPQSFRLEEDLDHLGALYTQHRR